MSSQIDDQTVFSQLDMDVPENALVDDSTIADDATLDERVGKTLEEDDVGSFALQKLVSAYRDSPKACSRAVGVLAKVLLPVILEDNQDTLVQSYKDTIKHNPWLVKMLVDAYSEGMYGNIQRIGLLRQLDRLSAAANPFC